MLKSDFVFSLLRHWWRLLFHLKANKTVQINSEKAIDTVNNYQGLYAANKGKREVLEIRVVVFLPSDFNTAARFILSASTWADRIQKLLKMSLLASNSVQPFTYNAGKYKEEWQGAIFLRFFAKRNWNQSRLDHLNFPAHQAIVAFHIGALWFSFVLISLGLVSRHLIKKRSKRKLLTVRKTSDSNEQPGGRSDVTNEGYLQCSL